MISHAPLTYQALCSRQGTDIVPHTTCVWFAEHVRLRGDKRDLFTPLSPSVVFSMTMSDSFTKQVFIAWLFWAQ